MLETFLVYDGHILDVRKLMRMRSYLDAASFLEIIEDFEVALRERLSRLRCTALEPTQIAGICHDLLNISGTLGMCELMSANECLREAIHRAGVKTDSNRTQVLKAGDRALAALENHKAEVGG
jgi:hypothetical protein